MSPHSASSSALSSVWRKRTESESVSEAQEVLLGPQEVLLSIQEVLSKLEASFPGTSPVLHTASDPEKYPGGA